MVLHHNICTVGSLSANRACLVLIIAALDLVNRGKLIAVGSRLNWETYGNVIQFSRIQTAILSCFSWPPLMFY